MLFQHTAARRRLVPSPYHRFDNNKFQHTAARRRLGDQNNINARMPMFQHTAARRRLVKPSIRMRFKRPRFNTQPPEGGWAVTGNIRIKAHSFNTQPPEGGWPYRQRARHRKHGFQHTAARRRLAADVFAGVDDKMVSTHSRPKAAGVRVLVWVMAVWVSTHSRPKAAGKVDTAPPSVSSVSTHSRPKAAGPQRHLGHQFVMFGFNTQPPEGGWLFDV